MNHYPLFHNTIFFVYGAFLLIILLGWNLSGDRFQPVKTALFAILSSVLFFIISNIGVWIFGELYDLTGDGLAKCFIMALPFFKITLIGDLFWTAVLFGAFEYIRIRKPALAASIRETESRR
jgi:hypothetical protein